MEISITCLELPTKIVEKVLGLGLFSLSLGSLRYVGLLFPWVLCIALSEDRHQLLLCDHGLTRWALRLLRLLHPLIDAWPAVKVSTQCNNGLFHCVQAYDALKHVVAPA